MNKHTLFGRVFIVTSIALVLGFAANAAEKKDTGPTQAQIDCQNRAVNDYWDQVKECDKALNDLPDQNALCKSDAADDLKRNKSACLKTAAAGGRLNDVKSPMATPTVNPGIGSGPSKPQIKAPMLNLNAAPP